MARAIEKLSPAVVRNTNTPGTYGDGGGLWLKVGPGAIETVERPAHVRVSYQDVDGTFTTEEADGLLAVCLQHEIDQLDGVFWLQRLSRLKRDRLVKKWEKQQKR
ncbi:peptide deformylase [Acidocella sp. KAb 2-4]|uniref:peptide deformylase n=1 Tax=Acidocella sp. KAb 2-4 TaxID=2885158 RepID=UPI001D073D74|nr:peptide deformylase [Acidocella sp. KAb 2-4]MCB5945752.1 peptide deformylase [Acidocella sp. KAb 2-4]